MHRVADLATRCALEQLEPGIHIDWFVYGLVGGKLKLEEQKVESSRRRP
jgi:hypothetical protein